MAKSSGPSPLWLPVLITRAGAMVPAGVSGSAGMRRAANSPQAARCAGVASAGGSASSFSNSVIMPLMVGESSSQQFSQAWLVTLNVHPAERGGGGG